MCDTSTRLILDHLPMVRRIAWKIAGGLPPYCRPHVDADDLTQEGALALIAVAEQFKVDRGIPFVNFCHRRVVGAMYDALRRIPKYVPIPVTALNDDMLPGDGMILGNVAALMASDDTRPDTLFRRTENVRILQSVATMVLTRSQRKTFDLMLFGDLNLRELADMIDVTQSAVCAVRQRTITKLHTELVRRGIRSLSDI